MNKRGLTDLGMKIFLDRYALKDTTRQSLQPGSTVLVKLDDKTGQKEVGVVEDIKDGKVLVSLCNENAAYAVDIEHVDVPLELDPMDMWKRVAQNIAEQETTSDKFEEWLDKFQWLLEDWKFVPGGRVLAGAGTDTELTYYNCYVIPSPKDSKDEIFKTCNTMAQIMSRGGGVGINISSLRPKYAYTTKTHGRSSGAVSWGELYSYTTGLIEQSGARRGALMLILNDWHPDLMEFINVKRDMKRILNANISVGISDAFMQAVEDDVDWKLKFPDTTDPDYDNLWDGDLDKWVAVNKPVKIWKTVKARELWDAIINSAWTCAEPGLWFKDRANSYSNSWYYSQLIATNPCVTGDTMIAVADGRNAVSIKQLAEEGADVPVYCHDGKHITRSFGRNPRMTQTQVPIMKLTFYSGKSIRCTADHKFMTITGAYKQAVDIEPGDSLMSYAGNPQVVMSVEDDGIDDVYNITVDTFHNYVMKLSLDDGIISRNCGEQPLPEWSVCLLGAINLSKFIAEWINTDVQYTVNWQQLKQAVRYAVRFMDNVIEATPYVYDEIKQKQLSERRIGLGIMGLAEMLVRLSLRYGSDESLKFIDELFQFIAVEAYNASIDLAIEKGSFPKCQPNNLVHSQFMAGMPEELKQRVLKHGLRNVTLLTCAPTGTTGSMVNTSTGIEPFYFWEFERKGRLGSHIERVKVYEEWLEQAKTHLDDDEPLPSWFVTAQDLTPKEHVKVQAAVQRWVDSSISKTCNVPNDYTVEQVKELYELMYELGCKGGTIYRDGSRSEQVLTAVKPSNSLATVETTLSENKPAYGLRSASGDELATRSRPATLTGKTYRKNTALGTAYVTVNRNGTDEAFETFVNVGKAGSDIAADAEGLGRLISFILRMPSPMTVQDRIENVVAQLGGIGSGRQHGFGKQRVMSLPDAIAQVLAEHISMTGELPKLPEYETEQPATLYYNGNADICPGCGNASLMRVEGCQKCYGCGHSQC